MSNSQSGQIEAMDDGGILYAVIKYIPDLFRQEPINIGVFVVDGDQALMRSVGVDMDGMVEFRMARRISILQDDSSHLAEWLAYWQRVVDAYNRSGEGARSFMESVIDDSGMLVVSYGGSYIPECDTTLEQIADRLYHELVVVPEYVEGDAYPPRAGRKQNAHGWRPLLERHKEIAENLRVLGYELASRINTLVQEHKLDDESAIFLSGIIEGMDSIAEAIDIP